MLNYDVLSKNPLHFRNFSGLELQEFDNLNQKIEDNTQPLNRKGSNEKIEKEQSEQDILSSFP